MPYIKEDVLSGPHLRQFPRERQLLVPFLANFDVNRAYSRAVYNTRVSAYFLFPDEIAKHQFGISGEVLLIISDFPTVQARTLQAVEQIMQEAPAAGRVDPTVFLLATPDSNAVEWIRTQSLAKPQSRIPVVFKFSDIIASNSDN